MMKKQRNKRFIPSAKINHGNAAVSAFQKTVLGNGVIVLSEEVPSVESFSVGISLGLGSVNDPPDMSGIAHFLEHAVFRRTKNKTTRQIASGFESVGAFTNAFTTKEQTCFYVRSLKSHFVRTFNLLAELVFKPVFLEKEFQTEKMIILEEIKSYEDDPEELICDTADALIFGSHPAGKPITGTEESIKRIGIEDLKMFHRTNYLPGNITVASAGNLAHERLVRHTEKIIGSIRNRYIPQDIQEFTFTAPQSIEERKPFTQAHLLYAKQVPGLRTKERYPLAVLNVLLGDGMSSRLYQQIREKRGLAYSVDSSVQMLTGAGVFYIYAALEEKNAAKAQKLIENELRKLTDNKLTAAEISRAKQQLKSEIVMSMESMSSRMQSMIKSEYITGRQESTLEKIQIVDSISHGDLKKCAEMYLSPEGWNRILFLPEN